MKRFKPYKTVIPRFNFSQSDTAQLSPLVEINVFDLLQRPSKWKVQASTPEIGFATIPATKGVGKVVVPDGTGFYLGEFDNGCFQGYGYLELTGDLFSVIGYQCGTFKKNLLNGENCEDCVWDGDSCLRKKGSFKDGELDGIGDWSYSGHRCEGTFVKGQIVKGKMTYTDGNYYVGELQNFREHGEGSFFIKKSGDEISCKTWMNGRAEGSTSYIWGCGNKMDTTYRRGSLIDGDVSYTDIHGWGFKNEKFVNDYPVRGKDILCDGLKKCINEGACTFHFTGKEKWGQTYFKRPTVSSDGYCESMQGYCLTCAKTCYPYHKKEQGMYVFSYRFSGNFYCMCGSGDFGLPCFAKTYKKE